MALHENEDAPQPEDAQVQPRPQPTQWLRTPKPLLVNILMLILALQFLAVAIYTVDGVIQLLLGNIEHVSVAIALIVFTALLAWFLWALLRGVALKRAWVRGPAVTIQIFVLLVGVSLVQGSFWVPGILLIVLGAATVGLLVSPQVVAYVGTRHLSED